MSEYIKPIPGKLKVYGAADTDLVTVLGYSGAALSLGGKNDGRSQERVATVLVDGEEYSLTDILLNVATLDKALDVVTATDATSVSIADAVVGTPLKVKAESIITQTSAGSQSFAVPKAITGNASVTVTNTIGEDTTVYTLKPSATLYGLSTATDNIQFDTGLVTRQTKHIILTGAESWTSGAGGTEPYVLTLSDKAAGTSNFACSHSVPADSGTTAETCVGAAAAKTITFYPNAAAAYNTLTKWKALLLAASTGASPVQLVYEIADTTEQLSPTLIPMQEGTNVFTHNAEGAITVNYYALPSKSIGVTAWAAWTPTLTWTTGAPASVTTVARYMKTNKTVFFNFRCASADGNGATALKFTLPVAPKDNNSFVAATALQKQNATWTNPEAYIDDGTSYVEFRGFATATDGEAVEVIVTGFYEIA